MTNLSFYEAYNKARTGSPKETYKNDLEAIVEQTFSNAPNVFHDEIECETEYGSNEFKKIPMVRVDSIVAYNTGILDSDDFKVFVFTPDFKPPVYGDKFRWGDNYWLVINSNNRQSINITAEVRRCNNVLRFFDKNGNKLYEPCIMDSTLRFTNNETTPPITVGGNEQKIWCQRNDRTTSIKPNDRFIFGPPQQRTSFRLYAGGMKNYLNSVTNDDNSPSIIEYYVEHYQIDPLFDDLENGFANAFINQYYIDINNDITDYQVGATTTLSAVVYKNKDIIDVPIRWVSDNDEIATISENGVLNIIGEGEVNISAFMENNESISDILKIVCKNTPLVDTYDIVLNPDVDYVMQGKVLNIEVYVYKNGVKQNDSINIIDTSVNVPRTKYLIDVIDNNHFSITNKGMFMDYPLLIECASDNITKTFEFRLRGLY